MTEHQKQINKKIKLVVSDFHMGKGPLLDDGSVNLLEDFFHDRRFIEFIAYYSTGIYEAYDVELIINGDFFNMLQVDYLETFPENCTEEIALSKMESIFNGHRDVFDALNRFCNKRGNDITFIIGNHDPGLFWTKVQKRVGEVISPRVKIIPHYYAFDGIYIEHGHQYEYLHHLGRHDAIIRRGVPEPVLNLSWGNYFVIQFVK